MVAYRWGKSFAAKPRTFTRPEADELLRRQTSEMKKLDRWKNAVSDGTKIEFYEWRKLHLELYRASEWETSMPPGHFLRTFGQSD